MSREVLQGKNIANAATHITTLEHFIWSSLPSVSTVSSGKLAVPHMDGKAEVDIHPQLPPCISAKDYFSLG